MEQNDKTTDSIANSMIDNGAVTDGVKFREVYPASSEFVGASDQYLNESAINDYRSIPGFKQTTNFTPKYSAQEIDNKKKSKRLISKVFSSLSRWGMSYDDDIIKNMRAIPADKNLLPKPFQLENQDLFTQLASGWKVKSNADKNFFEKDLPMKLDALRKLSVQPELEDILDTMTNECIVYDSNYVYFAEPFIDPNDLSDYTKEVQENITKVMSQTYQKLYRMLKWRTKAWDDFKRFLVDGILSWEIVYDSLEKPSRVIGLVPLNAATLTKKYENGKWYWVQFKGVQGKERKLLDSQVVYIQFQETEVSNRISYLERLVRPFNIYRIIEQAQIVWTVTNAQYKMKFVIPTKNMNRVLAQQTLNSAMNRYKEDIKFTTDTGELLINGQVNMPFNKEYWMPESENGTPEIETIGGDGPELNDNDQLKYFKNMLYKISKIPLNRFDQESGDTWFGTDATSAARTEIDFGRYVTRLRNIFSQIILKPLQIQIALSIPDIRDEKDFFDCIQLHYKSYNLFEEMMELELMSKRVEFISNMKDSMVDMDVEGNEIKYFSSEFLVKKYLHLSDQDIRLNNKLKQQEIEELNLAGGENEEEEEATGEFESLESINSLEPGNKQIVLEVIKELKKKESKKKEFKKKESKKKELENKSKTDDEMKKEEE